MCGRYASGRSVVELSEVFAAPPDERAAGLEPDFNVAPTKPVPAVLARRRRDDADASPVRRLTALRWGLVPSWARDTRGGARLINARLETAAEKPAFRRALAARRCLLPADGWYEWTPAADGGRRQPWLLRARDHGVLSLAGLYEVWRDPADPDGPLVWTSAVLTTAAVDDAGRVHDRMPLVVPPPAWEAWLDPRRRDATAARGLLAPAAAAAPVEAVPVSRAVNDVRSAGPHLVEPVDPASPRSAAAGGLDAGPAQPTLF